MEKQGLGSDVEKFIQDDSNPHQMSRAKAGRIFVGNFWGQLGLMALLTFLFSLCLFVIAGYYPSNSFSTTQVSCPLASSIPPGVDKVDTPPEEIISPISSLPSNPNLPSSKGSITVQQSQFVFAAVVTEFETEDSNLLINLADTPTSSVNKNNVNQYDTSSISMDANSNVQRTQMETGQNSDSDPDLSQLLLALNQVDEASTREFPKYFLAPKEAQMNWFEALQACLFEKMQLVAIETESKWQEVSRFITEELGVDGNDAFWTSGTNLWTHHRDQFFWASTGEQLNFTNWHAGNPSSAPDQNCIEITRNLDLPTNGSLLWNNYGCHSYARFICENL